MTSRLRAFFQKNEDERRELLKSNKYQHGVGLMTAAKPISERFSAVRVHDMLQQQKRDLFLERELALAIFDGRQCRSCTQKLADSSEPGTKWASKLVWMTFTEALGSLPLTDHKLLKLSGTRNVMTELLFVDIALTTVIKSLWQSSKTFKSSYGASLNEVRTSDICKELVSCGSLQSALETT